MNSLLGVHEIQKIQNYRQHTADINTVVMLMYMMHNSIMQQRHDKLPGIRDEIKSFHFWKAVRCEFLITLLYVFAGCGATTEWGDTKGLNDLRVAIAFGLAAATMVQCVGHISGAHMN